MCSFCGKKIQKEVGTKKLFEVLNQKNFNLCVFVISNFYNEAEIQFNDRCESCAQYPIIICISNNTKQNASFLLKYVSRLRCLS